MVRETFTMRSRARAQKAPAAKARFPVAFLRRGNLIANHFCHHLCVRIPVLSGGESLVLPLARFDYSRADRLGILNRRRILTGQIKPSAVSTA